MCLVNITKDDSDFAHCLFPPFSKLNCVWKVGGKILFK